MTKLLTERHELLARFERKFERKVRAEQFKRSNKYFRGVLHRMDGVFTRNVSDETLDDWQF